MNYIWFPKPLTVNHICYLMNWFVVPSCSLSRICCVKIVQNLLRNSSRTHSRRCVVPHPCACSHGYVTKKELSDYHGSKRICRKQLIIHEVRVLDLNRTNFSMATRGSIIGNFGPCQIVSMSFVNTNQGIWKFVELWKGHATFKQIEYLTFLTRILNDSWEISMENQICC